MKTHKELIKAHKFDEKFKNALRDYYNYGFKNETYYMEEKSKSTLRGDWTLLNNILNEYLEWSDLSECKEVMYVTQDSQAMDENPFHRVYRFCGYPETFPAYFFHTMAALSPCISLREGVAVLIDDSELLCDEEHLNECPKKHLKEQKRLEKIINVREIALTDQIRRLHLSTDVMDVLGRLYEDDEHFMEKIRELGLGENSYSDFERILKNTRKKMKSSDLLLFYKEDIFPQAEEKKTPKDRKKNLDNRLDAYERLGILKREQSAGQEGKRGGDRRWEMHPLTLKRLLRAGTQADQNFESHFSLFLDFYSRYYLLGEVGTFLLDRINYEEKSPFRFKHEYFMQSLNDFNILDLIHAIEKKYWCRIRYRHGTAQFQTELLCWPMEIRVSVATGREYLMFYEPMRRSYTALRIEFIDAIEYYDAERVFRVLKETRGLREKEIERDIENARSSLKYCWGVSVPAQEENARDRAAVETVKMRIRYDRETEPYIYNRMLRERRNGWVSDSGTSGILDYRVRILDAREMNPWIRSFYSRIETFESTSERAISLEEDLSDFPDRDAIQVSEKEEDRKPSEVWNIPDEITKRLGKGCAAREHEKLFHEIFGVYYHVIAGVFSQLCVDERLDPFTEKELDGVIRKTLYSLYQKVGLETEETLRSEIKTLLFTKGFVTKAGKKPCPGSISSTHLGTEYAEAYSFQYSCEGELDFYRDVIPLTSLEIRWLKTVLQDQRARDFLSEEEIRELRCLIEEESSDTGPFPMDRVQYYDRFRFPEKLIEKESEFMRIFLDGIRSEKSIYVRYRTNAGRIKDGEHMPVTIEFSKRNNRFQVYCISSATKRIAAFNLASIQTAQKTKRSYSRSWAEKKLKEYREKREKHVDIEFYDRKEDGKNLADRLLSELSPWRKRCVCDTQEELYKLRVYYQADDEIELVVRLMGYGKSIRIRESSIRREIEERVRRQRDMLKVKEKEGMEKREKEMFYL